MGSRTTALAALLFALPAAAATVSGIQWKHRYLAVADPDRTQVQAASIELSEIYDGIEAGTLEPFDLRLPEDERPDSAYVKDPRDPYAATYFHYQLAELPPGPAMALVNGVTLLHPNHVLIHGRALHELFRPGAPPERTNPALLALGRFDLLAVLLVFVPLCSIALLHDARSRELEGGTQLVLDSLGAGTHAIFRTRVLFRGALVTGCVVVAVGVAGIVAGVPSGRLFLLVLGATAYTALWVAIVGTIASVTSRSIGSIALALVVFLLLVFVGPGLSESLVRPDGLVTSRALVDAEIRALDRVWGATDRQQKRIAHVAKTYWGIPSGELPDCAYHADAYPDWSSRRIADHAFSQALASAHSASVILDRRLDLIGLVFPPLGFKRAMQEVAGSGPARAQLFEQRVHDYHAQWRDRGADALINCRRWNREAFAAAPTFHWEEPAPSVRTLSYAFAGLCLWSVLGFAALWRKEG